MRILLVGRSGHQLALQLTRLGHDTLVAPETFDAVSLGIPFPEVIWIDDPLSDSTAEELAAILRREGALARVTIVKQ